MNYGNVGGPSTGGFNSEPPKPLPPRFDKMASVGDMSTRSKRTTKSGSGSTLKASQVTMKAMEVIHAKEREVQDLQHALHREKLRADGAEDDVKEVVKRFHLLHSQKTAAVQEAAKWKAEMLSYKEGLKQAKRDLKHAHDVIRVVEQQRNVAEEDARAFKQRAIELQEEKEIVVAREEGRRQGILEGLSRARAAESIHNSASTESAEEEPSPEEEGEGDEEEEEEGEHVDIYADTTTYPDTRRQSLESAATVPIPAPAPPPPQQATYSAPPPPIMNDYIDPSGPSFPTPQVAPSQHQQQQQPAPGPSFPTPQSAPSYQASQTAPSYPTPQTAPSYPTPQVAPSYPTPQVAQSYQAPQAAPSYPTPQVAQSYQGPQAAPSYPVPQPAQTYPTPRVAQSYSQSQAAPAYPVAQPAPPFPMPQVPSYPVPQPSPSYTGSQSRQQYQVPQTASYPGPGPAPGPPMPVIHEEANEPILRVPPPKARAPQRDSETGSSSSMSQYGILNRSSTSRPSTSHSKRASYAPAPEPTPVPAPASKGKGKGTLRHYPSHTTLNMPISARQAGFDPADSDSEESASEDDEYTVRVQQPEPDSDSSASFTVTIQRPSRETSSSPPEFAPQQGGENLLSAFDAMRPVASPLPDPPAQIIADALPPGFIASGFTPGGSTGPLPMAGPGVSSQSTPVIPSSEQMRLAGEDPDLDDSTSSGMSGESGLTTPPVKRNGKQLRRSKEELTSTYSSYLAGTSPVPVLPPVIPVPVPAPPPAPSQRGKGKGKRGKR